MDNRQLSGNSANFAFGNREAPPEEFTPAPPPRAGASIEEMDYPKASIGNRILAYIVDGIIAGLPMILLSLVGLLTLGGDIMALDAGGPGLGGILILVLAGVVGGGWAFVYTLLRDGFGHGQSIGKRVTGLMVVRLTDNQPCGLGNSAVRNIFALIISLAVSWIPLVNFLGGLVEPVVALTHNKGHRLGDMVAKTQVIDVSQYRG